MSENSEKENLILKLTFEFAIKNIEFCDELTKLKKYVIAHQLLKSSTSIGANVREAQHAESNSDFIHKMKIAMKEAEETKYWLELCLHSKDYPSPNELLIQIESIIKVLSKILIVLKTKSKI
jgi:four helix bundle protein